MEIKKLIVKDSFSVVVNGTKYIKPNDKNPEVGYVWGEFDTKETLYDFLKETDVNDEKIFQVIQMVKLKSNLLPVSLSYLTKVEKKRADLARCLLLRKSVLVFHHFFEGNIYSEREYFKRLLRNFIHKHQIAIILLEDDMNVICEMVKQFYYMEDKSHCKLVTDFYDEEIYSHVSMPDTVELVKYFESCGHQVDHEITFNETLKAIYRGV